MNTWRSPSRPRRGDWEWGQDTNNTVALSTNQDEGSLTACPGTDKGADKLYYNIKKQATSAIVPKVITLRTGSDQASP
jgi:hypothetical protein